MSMLSAAAAQAPSRSASTVVAKPARGFHVLRVDGYSVTTTLPGGQRVTSEPFIVGARSWVIDYYPNGADGSRDSDDSDAIAVYLRLVDFSDQKERVRADYKFSLLDPAGGTAAYELPAETGIFTSAYYSHGADEDDEGVPNRGCGYASFITKEDLRRRSLLKNDSFAIRCDVGVAVLEVEPLAVAPNKQRRVRMMRRYSDSDSESPDDDEYDDGSHGGGKSRHQPPGDDKEFIRRCLTAQRRKYKQ
jgi:speckle-type POZ protein